MSTLGVAQQRLDAVIGEIERLQQSDFPYSQPRNALVLLKEKFKDQRLELSRLSSASSAAVVNQVCSTSLDELDLYLPIIGFILRSTNVRNAFEVYSPLLRLTRSVLGDDRQLIVSSEWDFTPFVYEPVPNLPGFVLIGLPATESSNPLMVPLAGHELGHAVWDTEGLSSVFHDQIRDRVLDALTNRWWNEYHEVHEYTKDQLLEDDMFARRTWLPAQQWADSQAEEIFSDLFGLRLFSEAYLHAFAYLVSPGIPGTRSLEYPNMNQRVAHLVKVAGLKQIAVPEGFESGFVAKSEPTEQPMKLLASVADHVSASLIPNLAAKAWDCADVRNVASRNVEHVKKICDEFLFRVVPTPTPSSLVDVLNAGWECYTDRDLWSNVPQIKREDRYRILQDLMLKSLEVAEFHLRLEE